MQKTGRSGRGSFPGAGRPRRGVYHHPGRPDRWARRSQLAPRTGTSLLHHPQQKAPSRTVPGNGATPDDYMGLGRVELPTSRLSDGSNSRFDSGKSSDIKPVRPRSTWDRYKEPEELRPGIGTGSVATSRTPRDPCLSHQAFGRLSALPDGWDLPKAPGLVILDETQQNVVFCPWSRTCREGLPHGCSKPPKLSTGTSRPPRPRRKGLITERWA